jgi:hypothetical protein
MVIYLKLLFFLLVGSFIFVATLTSLQGITEGNLTLANSISFFLL